MQFLHLLTAKTPNGDKVKFFPYNIQCDVIQVVDTEGHIHTVDPRTINLSKERYEVGEILICNENVNPICFESGSEYEIIESVDDFLVVMDKSGKEHVISVEYAMGNFTKRICKYSSNVGEETKKK